MESPYLTCHNLSASYGSNTLFSDLSFSVHPGERWGIVGPNGAGKSTLFKIISGILKPLQGTVSLKNNIRICFIDQKIDFDDNVKVEDILKNSLPLEYDTTAQIHLLEQDIEKLEAQAEQNSKLYEDEKWLDTFSELNTKLSEVQGTPTQNIIQSALKAGSLIEIAQNLFKNLSGGQQKRVQIIAALLKNPNLILMDEPTNHLDVQTVEWLEEFLLQVVEQGFSLFGLQSKDQEIEPVAFVIISHDRALLDTLVNKILEVEHGEAQYYSGNYEDYSHTKLERLCIEEKSRMKMANTMRRELEWLRSGTRARTTKQTARIERAQALDKNLTEKERKARLQRGSELTFSAQMTSEQRDKDDTIMTMHHNLGEQELVRLYDVTLSHPNPKLINEVLFEKLNLTLKPKTRLAILGPNGCGKTTLLNTISHKLNPLSGEIKYHDLVSISYFDQKRHHLDYQETLRKNLAPQGDNVYFGGKYIHIMSYLDRFLFTKNDANKPVSEMSGGEQARLLLAKLMLEQGNLLILDEPTNDLDINTLQILEKNLIEFNGAVVFTSHDRYFMQRVATACLTYLGKKNNKHHWGLYSDLNQALEHMESFQSQNNQKLKSDSLKVQATSSNEKSSKKLNFKDQREFENIENSIFILEEKIAVLTKQLDHYYIENKNHEEILKANTEIEKLHLELQGLFKKWEKFI